MTHNEDAAVWIGLLVLLLLYLKFRVGAVRNKTKTGFGDGNSNAMQRAIRVQGNAVEDVPPTLIGLLVLAMLSPPIWVIHVVGGVLLGSRMLHAFGLGKSSGVSFGRLAGTLGSVLAMLGVAGACIFFALT